MASDINFCTAKTLSKEAKIPMELANRIVAFREKKGGIQDFEELAKVGRMTRTVLNRIKDTMELHKVLANYLREDLENKLERERKQEIRKQAAYFEQQQALSPTDIMLPLLQMNLSEAVPVSPGPPPVLLYAPVKVQPSDSGYNIMAQYSVLSPEQCSSPLSCNLPTEANGPTLYKHMNSGKQVTKITTPSPTKTQPMDTWWDETSAFPKPDKLQPRTSSPTKSILKVTHEKFPQQTEPYAPSEITSYTEKVTYGRTTPTEGENQSESPFTRSVSRVETRWINDESEDSQTCVTKSSTIREASVTPIPSTHSSDSNLSTVSSEASLLSPKRRQKTKLIFGRKNKHHGKSRERDSKTKRHNSREKYTPVRRYSPKHHRTRSRSKSPKHSSKSNRHRSREQRTPRRRKSQEKSSRRRSKSRDQNNSPRRKAKPKRPKSRQREMPESLEDDRIPSPGTSAEQMIPEQMESPGNNMAIRRSSVMLEQDDETERPSCVII